MAGKKIFLLGGGTGGDVAANLLRKETSRDPRVVLIDRKPDAVFAPSLLWVIVGKRQLQQIRRPIASLSRKRIEVIQAEATRIDPAARTVAAGDQILSYDSLIISLGADLAPETVPGLVEEAHSFYEPSGALRLWEAVRGFPGGRVVILIAATPFKCPAAPYEAALLLDDYFKKRGIRKDIDLQIFTPETLPMPVAGQKIGKAVKQILEERDIIFNPEKKVNSIDGKNKTIMF